MGLLLHLLFLHPFYNIVREVLALLEEEKMFGKQKKMFIGEPKRNGWVILDTKSPDNLLKIL